ncbi:MAG: enamine deaminase RidA [Bordetella sp. SCN 68-11]|nr:MAG: enamine deaminase RidA [Bordetella sp. SCN 68-11]OJW95191.1 MAG: enamine deaminase RidA [Burkholderiales bacterium 67-32]
MIALDAQSGQLESGGVAAETDKIMRNMLGALPEYGLTLDQLVIARIFTTRFDQFAEINRVWEGYFPEGATPPARTAMGVVALPLNATVEIEFCFYREA